MATTSSSSSSCHAPKDGKVGIIGSGLVGKSWAMIFASKGYQVVLYDILESQIRSAIDSIRVDLEALEKDGTLRGTLTSSQQHALIRGTSDLKECIEGCFFIQECVPENLDLKRKVWAQVDQLVQGPEVILASSSSCILPSKICQDLEHRAQFIVAHPVNPPYHVPMVELVPSEWTDVSIKDRCRSIMEAVGQIPVSMTRELPGFVLNRIQYAILNECWNLVADGVVSAKDLDVVMKDGLGLRYAVCGPMEVIHLNAEGLKKYCETYGHTIYNVSKDMKPLPETWKMETPAQVQEVEKVHQQLVEMYPMDQLAERRLRRDKALAAISKLKKDLQL